MEQHLGGAADLIGGRRSVGLARHLCTLPPTRVDRPRCRYVTVIRAEGWCTPPLLNCSPMGQYAVPGRGESTSGADGPSRTRPGEPCPALGRAVTALATGSAVGGAVLVLPTGEPVSTRRPSALGYAAVQPLARSLARAGAPEGLAAHVVRYRGARLERRRTPTSPPTPNWAADEVGPTLRRRAGVPRRIGMGGRAAPARGRPRPPSTPFWRWPPGFRTDDVAAGPRSR